MRQSLPGRGDKEKAVEHYKKTLAKQPDNCQAQRRPEEITKERRNEGTKERRNEGTKERRNEVTK